MNNSVKESVNESINGAPGDSAQWNWVELVLGLVMGALAICLALASVS